MSSHPSTIPPRSWRFGEFELDAQSRELRKNGLRIRMQEQPTIILEALLAREGQVVSREELRQLLWPADMNVEFERGLNTAVAKLRQVLSDSAEKPRYVETVARRGYRFVGRVETDLHPGDQPPPEDLDTRPAALPGKTDQSPVKPARRVRWALAVLLVLACPGGYWVWSRASVSNPSIRFAVSPPLGTRIHPISAISPNGRSLAFVAVEVSGQRSLWIRTLDSEKAIRLERTEGAIAPFFSPDSQSIGFFADGKLRTIPVFGGTHRTLCGAPQPAGGTWNRDNVILFSASGRLHRVPAMGGDPAELPRTTPPSGETRIDAWPQFLPDGRRFIISTATHTGHINWIRSEVLLGTLDSKDSNFLVDSRSRAVVTPDGYLLFGREQSLAAQKLDLKRGLLTGPVTIVAEEVSRASGEVTVDIKPGLPVAVAPATFSASENGVLAFHSTPPFRKQLVWFNPDGTRVGKAGEPGDYMHMAVSPDDQYVALAVRNRNSFFHWNLWLLHLKTNVLSQLGFSKGRESDTAWSPDSSRIVYAEYQAERGERVDLMEVKLGDRAARQIYSDGNSNKPEDWSADGTLLVRRNEQIVFTLPMSGTGTPAELFQTPHLRFGFRFSPDHRWLAYASTESGTPEVFVSRYPGLSGTRQVSAGGGFAPVWRKDGKGLFYMTQQGFIVSVSMNTGPRLVTGPPKTLFRTDARHTNMPQFAATADGRFLVLEAVPQQVADERLVVMTGWRLEQRP